jgi:hypothetical protein
MHACRLPQFLISTDSLSVLPSWFNEAEAKGNSSAVYMHALAQCIVEKSQFHYVRGVQRNPQCATRGMRQWRRRRSGRQSSCACRRCIAHLSGRVASL